MENNKKQFPKFMASDKLIILATSENNGFISGTVIHCIAGSKYDLGYHSTKWFDILFEDVECEITIK